MITGHESLLFLMISKLWLQQKGEYVAAIFDPPKEMVRFHSRRIANADAKLRKQILVEI